MVGVIFVLATCRCGPGLSLVEFCKIPKTSNGWCWPAGSGVPAGRLPEMLCPERSCSPPEGLLVGVSFQTRHCLRIAQNVLLRIWGGRDEEHGPGRGWVNSGLQPCHPANVNRKRGRRRPRRTELSSHSSSPHTARVQALLPHYSPHGIPADPVCATDTINYLAHNEMRMRGIFDFIHGPPPLSQRSVSNLSPAWLGRSCRCCPEHWQHNLDHCTVSPVSLATWLQPHLASSVRTSSQGGKTDESSLFLAKRCSVGRSPILPARGPAPLPPSAAQRNGHCAAARADSYITLPRVVGRQTTGRQRDVTAPMMASHLSLGWQ